jgi:probable phosphoglycerate mutase
MRHGDVSYFNEAGKPVRPDTVTLNERGHYQAEACARELAAVPIDRIVSSDLPRSLETARVLAAGRNVTVEPQPALREIQPGRLADLPPDGVERAFLGAFASGLGRDTRFLGGETIGSLVDRALTCWRNTLSDPAWRQLLIVAHGGVNRAILTHVLKSDLSGFAALEQDPCCINIIDIFEDGRCLVRLLNHTPYDAPKGQLVLTNMETLYAEYRRIGR